MRLYRSRIFTPLANPFHAEDVSATYRYIDDGYLLIDGRYIRALGEWSDRPDGADIEVVDCGRNSLLAPGFIDTHLHAPQLEMIGSYGGHLLEWLNRYTFPTEMKFADPAHARMVAVSFYEELLRNGTTSALIFSTIHTEATEIFFEEAERRGFRGIIGKTLMNRNAPAALLEETPSAIADSRDMIRRWSGKNDLLGYAITPRFAPTCTAEMLQKAGELKSEFPDVWVHSHVSENTAEVQWVHELFPEAADYVSVYDTFGLLSERSVLAHGVHLSAHELDLLSARETRLAHCPNSNLFLGSGLFPLADVLKHGVKVGLGTDIGAGTTPSLFNAMADAYKVQQVRGVSLSPFHLWYLATLGGAETLSLDERTGSLEVGKEADFVQLSLDATPLMALRTAHATALEDLLAGLIFIGDDRVVRQTWVAGRATLPENDG
jgi:guanine deaminase